MTDRGESGVAVTELLLVTPLLVMLLLFVTFGGRLVQARGDVDAAARDAARAATLTRSPADATAAAHQAAAMAVGGGTAPCAPLTVDVDTSGFRPGGQVTVTVACDLRLDDLALLGVPGTRTLVGRATSPVDTYRGNADGFGISEGLGGSNSRVGGHR